MSAWFEHMGYTQQQAADALGVSRVSYARLLAGDTSIDRRTVLACAALASGLQP